MQPAVGVTVSPQAGVSQTAAGVGPHMGAELISNLPVPEQHLTGQQHRSPAVAGDTAQGTSLCHIQ